MYLGGFIELKPIFKIIKSRKLKWAFVFWAKTSALIGTLDSIINQSFAEGLKGGSSFFYDKFETFLTIFAALIRILMCLNFYSK